MAANTRQLGTELEAFNAACINTSFSDRAHDHAHVELGTRRREQGRDHGCEHDGTPRPAPERVDIACCDELNGALEALLPRLARLEHQCLALADTLVPGLFSRGKNQASALARLQPLAAAPHSHWPEHQPPGALSEEEGRGSGQASGVGHESMSEAGGMGHDSMMSGSPAVRRVFGKAVGDVTAGRWRCTRVYRPHYLAGSVAEDGARGRVGVGSSRPLPCEHLV